MRSSIVAALLLVTAASVGCAARAIEPPQTDLRYSSVSEAIRALGADTANVIFIVDGLVVQHRDSLPAPENVTDVEIIRAAPGHCLKEYMVDGECPKFLVVRLRHRAKPA